MFGRNVLKMKLLVGIVNVITIYGVLGHLFGHKDEEMVNAENDFVFA